MMLREELKSLVGENMYQLKEQINDMPNHFPFNLAKDLSDQLKHCDIRKLYDVINNKLDPKHGAALILKYKYKFSYERIEETLGYTPGCGFMIINKILYRLRNYYDIYVYDKEYIDTIYDIKIKRYEDEINNLKTEISKLNMIKDILTSPKDDQNTNIKTDDK